jgi:alpha-galactosidase
MIRVLAKFFYLNFIAFTATAQSDKQLPGSISNKFITQRFDKVTDKLRQQLLLPAGYKKTSIKTSAANDEIGNVVFLHISGENRAAHHGAKLTGGSCGMRLQYAGMEKETTATGETFIISEVDTLNHLLIKSFFQLNNVSPVIRRYTVIENRGTRAVNIEYASSAMLYNMFNMANDNLEKDISIYYANNGWMEEGQWKKQTPAQLGWVNNEAFNLSSVSFSNTGSWSTVKYLPLGMVENKKAGLTWFWQIEHNGSWYYEMSDGADKSTYMYAGGPDALHAAAPKNLQPGETYTTVPVAVGCVQGSFNEAVAALTHYRRNILLKPHDNNKYCPVIFNDYMNCLSGNPTTEKELPYINAAAKAGADYYVIDAGWYAELNKSWWDEVGEWKPAATRFPNGLPALMDSIKAKGMIPGLWLEPEVIGINAPLKNKPDNWFLKMYGKRIVENSRYLLDFRNPEVVAYMNAVVERMVNELGAGYIKMDYNNFATGAENDTTNAGQGLLEHNRAVVQWYKNLSNKYPELVIENCGSGGNRMDYAMLAQTQIQSSSDQTNYKKYPAIITGTLAAVLPEQLAAWSYPLANGSEAQTSFNMVTAMLCRIHLSGQLALLNNKNSALVKEGIDVYKSTLQKIIPAAVPFFPLGLPDMADDKSPVAVGLKAGNKKYIAIWRLNGAAAITLNEKVKKVKLLYPASLGIKLMQQKNSVTVSFPSAYMGAVIEVE